MALIKEPAKTSIGADLRTALTFDDILLVPRHSTVLPAQVDVSTRLTRNIRLNVPLLSAAMDTVTESGLAIAMAQLGAMGIIHKNLSIQEQASEVDRVKRSESGMIVNPITLAPTNRIYEAQDLMTKYRISGVPITEDVGTTLDEARDYLPQHKVEKLLVVDKDYRLKGLITVKDIQKAIKYPNACKDSLGRLRCGAAVGIARDTVDRADALVAAHADVLVVDTAHGHSKGVLDAVAALRKRFPDMDLVAGNVATAEG